MSLPQKIERHYEVVQQDGLKEIWLAGGCFWGTEEYLLGIEGVKETSVGYANGQTENPTYEDVCKHDTGHAEAVHVLYNPQILPLNFLLRLYFQSINPLSLNQQGPDIGTQYRTGIYYLDEAERPLIEQALEDLIPEINRKPVVEVAPITNYYLAEEYHQRYLQKNPAGYCHIPEALFAKARQAKAYPRPEQAELKKRLTDLEYRVTQEDFTEPPFKNAYWDFFEAGIYVDIVNDEPLFLSVDKFKCSCGWASFSKPLDFKAIQELPDITHGMNRTEVRSKNADSHLGHVFNDGPKDRGGLRYCINSAAVRFVPLAEMAAQGYAELLPLLEATLDKKT